MLTLGITCRAAGVRVSVFCLRADDSSALRARIQAATAPFFYDMALFDTHAIAHKINDLQVQ
eukprot:3427471-Rhodomonas_salina.1